MAGYAARAGAFDEMVTSSGEVRPHWKAFADMLAKYPHAEMLSRRETIQRSLRDQGVTYNIYDDSQGSARHWALDLLPVIISAPCGCDSSINK